jgi:glyoxylase-like metal-dependent hydrolase (beta-lactamase superfamily II)
MYEVDFLRPGDGNGDAICIRYGSEQQGGYWLHVVDGGFSGTADTVIAHIEEHYGKHYHINHMVLSHADNDHASGLIGILKRFDVNGAIWMNRPWRFAAQALPAFHGNYTVDGLVKKMRDTHPYLVEPCPGPVPRIRSQRVRLKTGAQTPIHD